MRFRPPLVAFLLLLLVGAARADKRPNILIAIADDQSWPHASAYGCEAIETPAFDRVAREGVLFTRAFAPSPGCSPTRAALLTGRNIWQIEHAGTHWSTFPTKYQVYPDALERAGYWVGHTGKGWAPGNKKGWPHNPAGPAFNEHKRDYAANFEDFLAQRPDNAPFVFWYGSRSPHRPYKSGSGEAAGIDLDEVEVPSFLPDVPEVRSDVADYLAEIQQFDAHLGKMLDALQEAGELDNTLVIATSDNGMPFPRAKANLYEYGVHMPLAVCWPARVPGGRKADDLVNLIDLTATIYDATGVAPPKKYPPAGRSLMALLLREGGPRAEPKKSRGGEWEKGRGGDSQHQPLPFPHSPPRRRAVYFGRERHSSSRYNNWGYPARAIRTDDYLYIRNFHPERWPAGAPRAVGKKPHSGYHDIDAGPTLALLVARRDEPAMRRYLELAVAKRPAEELFDVRNDPGCLHNLADDPAHAKRRAELAGKLEAYLKATGDSRMGEKPEIWETYPRYGGIRKFPPPKEAAESSAARPNFVFFLVDDLGWADVGCFGSAFYETPRIDALAASGMRFTHGYAACPVCSPTRASIMTGRHPVRVDITDWIPGMRTSRVKDAKFEHVEDRNNLALEEVTIAEALKQHGYQTFFAGKWHLGGKGHLPTDQGFDINIGGNHHGSPPGGYYAPWKNPNLKAKQEGEYLTERLTEESLAFLENRDPDKPFLLYLSFYNVHTPVTPYKKRHAHFQEKASKRFDGPTPSRAEHEGVSRTRQDNAAYASMVRAVDDGVGAVLDKLAALGLDDNTVVIFFSDNGGLCTTRRMGPTSNLPLRAGKGWLYEGGVRVPMIVRVPGVAKPRGVCAAPVVSMDFFPTMLELAGLPAMPERHADGHSLVPLLKGETAAGERTLYWHYPHYHGSTWTPGASIRDGDWKLIEFYHWEDAELYNLKNDPGEHHDLSEENPEKTRELLDKLHRWQRAMNARMPMPRVVSK